MPSHKSFSQIYNFLKKNPKESKKKLKIKLEILDNQIFYSNIKLDEKFQIYYKFPFRSDIQNDKSKLFINLYNEYRNALLGISANYKKYGYFFYLLYKNETIAFEKSCIMSIKLKNICDENNIQYEIKEKNIILSNINIFLLIDYFLTKPIYENTIIPFIISHHMFNNSIVYRTGWKEHNIIKRSDNIQYKYSILNYFINLDFPFAFNK